MWKHATVWAALVWSVSSAVLCGCSSDDHPPVYLEPTRGGSGSGGATGEGAGNDGASGADGAPVGGDSGGLLSSTFDPAEVYIHGTLAEGACNRDAVAHWSTPNSALTGFPCDYLSMQVDPHRGRLVVLVNLGPGADLYDFVPDGDGLGLYPQKPEINDVPIPTLCLDPANFFTDPAGGELVYLCSDADNLCTTGGCPYYYESGAEYAVPEGYYLVHRGLHGADLLRTVGTPSEETLTIRDRDGALHPVTQELDTWIFRAHEEGFWALVSGNERWNIALDGTVSLDGVYPDPPPASRNLGSGAFEASGALIRMGVSTGDPVEDQIFRSELGDVEAEVVYTEAGNPLVKLHASEFFTGP
jgi:hypothetical protein